MVRPCAKYARQNCFAPTQKIPTAKNAVGKFFASACPHPACAVFFGLTPLARSFLGFILRETGKERVLTLHARRANSSRNGVLKTAAHRQTNGSKKCSRLFVGLPSPRLRGLFGCWYYERQERSCFFVPAWRASVQRMKRRAKRSRYPGCSPGDATQEKRGEPKAVRQIS